MGVMQLVIFEGLKGLGGQISDATVGFCLP